MIPYTDHPALFKTCYLNVYKVKLLEWEVPQEYRIIKYSLKNCKFVDEQGTGDSEQAEKENSLSAGPKPNKLSGTEC